MSGTEKQSDLVRRASKVSLLGPAARNVGSVPVVNVERADDEMESSGNHKGVALKMPSTQAAKLTKAYNRLLEMKQTGSVEGIVLQQIETVEKELELLKRQCDLVKPADSEQAEFKNVWMQKYVASKEDFVARLRDALISEAASVKEAENVEEKQQSGSVYSCQSRVSVSSSVRHALAQAEEDQAKLVLKTKQLAEQQEFRRRQQERRRKERELQEEEERVRVEQQERHELELQLEGVRARREALSRAASDVGSRHSGQGSELNVPRLRHPTAAWLEGARSTAESHRAEQTRECWPGGFVAASAPNSKKSLQDQLLQHIVLAQAKLPVFKGEPLDFLWFQKAFNAQVSAVTEDPERRLYLLLQQLQGPPHDLVKGCQLLPPAEGYERAMKKLNERYGHPVRQAMAFRNKLLAWPAVKSAEDLERFNVQLQLCHDIKLAGHGLGELDSPATLLQLASKLTNKLQLSWQTKAFDIESSQVRAATYEDFVKFVQRQAGLRTHPVYGKLNGDGRLSETKVTKVAATNSHEEAAAATVATKQMLNKSKASDHSEAIEDEKRVPNAFKAPCLLCQGNHATNSCGESNNLPKKEVYEKLQGLCFGCLKPGHLARRCSDRAVCKKCEKHHPTILHREAQEGRKGNGNSRSEEKTNQSQERTLATRDKELFAVSTVPIKIWQDTDAKVIEVQAVLDPASTATFITAKLANLLGATPQKAEIGITTMSSSSRMPVGVIQGLKVSGVNGEEEFKVPTAYAVETLPFSEGLRKDEVDRWPHLQEVAFEYRPQAPVAVLLGLNVSGALRPLEVVQGGKEEPYAVKTALGWAIQGPLTKLPSTHVKTCWTKVTEQDILRKLNHLHYHDFAQAFDFESKGPSQDDREWQDIVEKSVNRKQVNDNEETCQYVIDLPFSSRTTLTLKNNCLQAQQRLQTLWLKFKRKPRFRADYWEFMEKMKDKGYVEEVPEANDEPPMCSVGPHDAVNYVIHHGVYHPRKPGKIRVVFNCASKYQGVALNDLLLPGPDLTNSLVGVLLRFRERKVAFMADIESMFYRVQVPERQRDALRFLWWRGEEDEQKQKPTAYRLKVHLFGAASSPSIANFALQKAAEDAKLSNKIEEKVERAVKENFYVDDCLKSVETEEEAINMALGLIKACAFGGFRLTKFVATSKELLKALPESELAKELEKVDLSDDKSDPLGGLQERALGVVWQVQKDCFKFEIKDVIKSPSANAQVTKRNVLSKLSALYDPLGMAAPVVIVARILFRELTQEELGWDESLDNPQYQNRWLKWERELKDLESLSVPRCLTTQYPEKGQLHVFCDASVEAYAAVAYLRQKSASSEAQVAFVLGKARVSPPKVVTVPRLELTAAKLAVELARTIGRELPEIPVSKRVFWTDSMTVLKYLRNRSKRFHVFVANRVCTILNSSKVSEWRHVPSQGNPADEATRGLAAGALDSSMWLKGPPFLAENEQKWPDDPEEPLSADDPEVRKEERVAALVATQQLPFPEVISRKQRSAHKVRYFTAIWIKFKTWLQSKRTDKPTKVAVHDLKQAEAALIKWVQNLAWPEEMHQLQEAKNVRKHSILYKLSPKLSDGMVVMDSRIRTLLPIIPMGEYAERLVQEAHEQQGHQGRQATAAAVQRRYWIVGLNKLVRKLVRKCPSCQRRHSKPSTTVMAPLPACRFRPQCQKAFYVTGVDYFGPFHPTRGRGTMKAYGVIFTCTTTRAVHLEVAEDLSSSSFLNALRRFVSRRGRVHQLMSDNGTNFVGANTILHELRKEELKRQQDNGARIISELRKRDIDWVFNAPNASHHGGFWERLIRSIRRVLEALLERSRLTYEVLITTLCECEFILNNRPLTTVSDDPEDFEALTPNHLLIGSDADGLAIGLPGDFDDTAGALRYRWRQVQGLANGFWKRWHAEYKVLLQQRAKWHRTTRSLQVNDPVLIVDAGQPRECWKLGRVVKVHRNEADEQVRVVEVKTKDGLLIRPITKLCLLETASENE